MRSFTDIEILDKKEIRNVIEKRFRKIQKYCDKISKDFDVESIHEMRVEVKKLRALMRMMSSELPEPDDLKLPRKLKDVYGKAGIGRDLQLQIQRMKTITENEENKPNEYIQLLENELRDCKEKLKDTLSHDPLHHIENRIKDDLPSGVDQTTIRNFVFQRLTTIAHLISSDLHSEQDIHTVRKNLKDILYNIKALQQDLQYLSGTTIWNETELIKIEELEQELGLFNDYCNALSFLTPAYLNDVNPVERLQLKGIREQLTNEKEKLRINLIQKLNEFQETRYRMEETGDKVDVE